MELGRILDQQNDVEGEPDDVWTPFVDLGKGMSRSRVAMELKEPDTLKVSCRTLKLVDEARAWLEDIAESVVSFKSGK